MITVAFLVRSLNFGGAQRQLVTLAKRLDKGRFRVTVLCFYPDGPLLDELKADDVTVVSLEKRGRWDVLRFVYRLIRCLRDLKPEVLHSYLEVPNIIGALIKPLLPQTKLVWGIRTSKLDLSQYDPFTRATFVLARLFSRFADLIVVNSNQGLANYVAQGFPKRKMVVIPNGIDTANLHPDEESGRSMRRAWDISTQACLIGLVGRFDPVKDHLSFLRAAAYVVQDVDEVFFVCIGSIPEQKLNQLREFCRELGIDKRVHWVGQYSDMKAVYNALDICVSSSYGEGFSNALGEAMACGTPCVATDVGDSALILGDSGIIVPAGNPQALAAGMIRMIEMLRRQPVAFEAVGIRARQRIIDSFGVDRLVESTQNCLTLLSNSARK